MIQLSEFFQYSFVLILKRKCLVGASRVRFGESGTPSTIIHRRWSSRGYELGYRAPMVISGSGNGLSPVRRQVITWTTDAILSNRAPIARNKLIQIDLKNLFQGWF